MVRLRQGRSCMLATAVDVDEAETVTTAVHPVLTVAAAVAVVLAVVVVVYMYLAVAAVLVWPWRPQMCVLFACFVLCSTLLTSLCSSFVSHAKRSSSGGCRPVVHGCSTHKVQPPELLPLATADDAAQRRRVPLGIVTCLSSFPCRRGSECHGRK